MSVTLNFHVCHQNITRADSCSLVADSLNYAYAHFDFCSSDWDGLIKTAVFTRGQDTYEQILEDDQCLIPWEVLPDGKGIFTVSVFAGNRITTNVVKVKLDASGWSFALESSQPPTEGVYSQILTRLADVEDTVVESAESAAQSATSAAESAQSAEQSMEAARTAKNAAEEAAGSVTQYSKTSESWAVGGTGTRTGEDTDNSKYYAEQAGAASQTAVSAGNIATGAAQAATQAAGSASQSARTAAEGAQIVQELYDGAVSDITAAKTAAVGAIQTKGDQVLDSIPEDYTELSGDVTQLKADLSLALQYKHELKDGYITYNNGVVHTSTSRKYTEFPVSYGMSVYYSFNDGAAYNMGVAFYSEAGAYISGAIAQSTPQIVEVPENAVLCKATARDENDSLPIDYNNAIQINRVNTEKVITVNVDEFDYLENQYAYYSRKNLAHYTGINVIAFPVFEGMQFTYSMINSNPNNVGLHFRNATDGYVSGVQAIANPVNVTVPATATMCYASVYNKSQITFTDLVNALIDNASNTSAKIAGLETTTEPLENITDITGMLDIFLNVGCIGDSLASGESYWNDGGTNQGADFYQYSWGQYLARKTGNKYYNWSKGGLSTKLWLQSEYAIECFDGQHLCEAYIIGLGQNDANYNYTIGTSADIDLTNYNNNADTFYGSYGKIIQKIKEVQPQSKIFVITDPNTSTDTKGYNVAIRNMATIFDNVYVVDMCTYALKYMQSPVLIAQLRAGHFNAYGYKVFSMMIANYIDWIVTTNYTEFIQAELIGTGHSWT